MINIYLYQILRSIVIRVFNMANQLALGPIRTSNMIVYCAFGYTIDFLRSLNYGPNQIKKNLRIALHILSKFKGWKLYQDKTKPSIYTIYHKNTIQSLNNVGMGLRTIGNMKIYNIPDKYFKEAEQIQFLFKKYLQVLFLNKKPTICNFSHFTAKLG